MSKDPRFESWLTREGVTFHYAAKIPLSNFDDKASLGNQARLGKPLIEERVQQYATAFEQGAEFPALIAYQGKDGKYILIAGNHRLAAAQLTKRRDLDAYVVEIDDAYIVRRLTVAANSQEGMGTTREESIIQALDLMQRFKRSAAEVAPSFNLKPAVLDDAMRRKRAAERLTKLGVPTVRLSPSTLQVLGSVKNDNALKDAAKLVNSTRLGWDRVTRLVTEVNDRRTEEAQREVIQQWSQRPDIKRLRAESRGGRTKPKPTVGQKLTRQVADLATTVNNTNRLSDLGITSSAEIRELHDLWTNTDKKMTRMLRQAVDAIAS